MIVIGGKSSSNSRKLYETASAVCPATVWIETAEQLTPERFRGIARLGITAGASTPDSVIEEVVNKMANEKILVVDDDKNICELLRLYLVKEGYNVTLVHDGAAALTEFD